jgi:hypothetical protein
VRGYRLVILWVALQSAWGGLGAQLNLNGPSQPGQQPMLWLCFGLFLTAVLAHAPAGHHLSALPVRRLLLLALFDTVLLECWYVITMFASSDPRSDTTAAVGVLLSSPFLFALLAALLLAGAALSRWRLRRGDAP